MANELNPKIIAQMLDLNRNIGQLTAEIKKNNGIVKSSQEDKRNNTQDPNATAPKSGLEKNPPIFEEISKDLKKIIANSEKTNKEEKERQEKKETESKEKEKKEDGKFDWKSMANALLKTDAFKPLLDKVGENSEGFNVFRKLTKSLTPEILKNFQTGGVAKREGNYLVGENGPEIVKLPTSSAVIPLDIKDLSEGLTKIPELSKIVKEGKISIYANKENPSILQDGTKDIKNRLSLKKLLQKYEEQIDDLENENSPEAKALNQNYSLLEKLFSSAETSVKEKVQKVQLEKNKLFSSEIFGGASNNGNYKLYNELWDQILKTLPKDYINDLSVSEASLLATKMVIEKSLKNKEKKEKESGEESMKRLLDKEAPKEIKVKESTEDKTSSAVNRSPALSKSLTGTTGDNKNPFTLESLKKEVKTILSSGANPQEILDGVLNKEGVSNLFKNSEGLLEKSPILKGLSGKIKPGPELKTSITPLSNLAKPKKEDIGTQFKELNENIRTISRSPETQGDKTGGTSGTASGSSGSPDKSPDNQGKGGEASTNAQGEPKMGEGLKEVSALLARIASILEGPLEVFSMESPFRPDSRKV